MTWSHITTHTLQPAWAKPFGVGEKVPGRWNKVGAGVGVRPASLPPSRAYAGGCGLTLWVSLCREGPDSCVYLVTFVSLIMEMIPWLLMKLLYQA